MSTKTGDANDGVSAAAASAPSPMKLALRQQHQQQQEEEINRKEIRKKKNKKKRKKKKKQKNITMGMVSAMALSSLSSSATSSPSSSSYQHQHRPPPPPLYPPSSTADRAGRAARHRQRNDKKQQQLDHHQHLRANPPYSSVDLRAPADVAPLFRRHVKRTNAPSEAGGGGRLATCKDGPDSSSSSGERLRVTDAAAAAAPAAAPAVKSTLEVVPVFQSHNDLLNPLGLYDECCLLDVDFGGGRSGGGGGDARSDRCRRCCQEKTPQSRSDAEALFSQESIQHLTTTNTFQSRFLLLPIKACSFKDDVLLSEMEKEELAMLLDAMAKFLQRRGSGRSSSSSNDKSEKASSSSVPNKQQQQQQRQNYGILPRDSNDVRDLPLSYEPPSHMQNSKKSQLQKRKESKSVDGIASVKIKRSKRRPPRQMRFMTQRISSIGPMSAACKVIRVTLPKGYGFQTVNCTPLKTVGQITEKVFELRRKRKLALPGIAWRSFELGFPGAPRALRDETSIMELPSLRSLLQAKIGSGRDLMGTELSGEGIEPLKAAADDQSMMMLQMRKRRLLREPARSDGSGKQVVTRVRSASQGHRRLQNKLTEVVFSPHHHTANGLDFRPDIAVTINARCCCHCCYFAGGVGEFTEQRSGGGTLEKTASD
eukprot:jgi/Bigna1/141869/aug1.65_g16577